MRRVGSSTLLIWLPSSACKGRHVKTSKRCDHASKLEPKIKALVSCGSRKSPHRPNVCSHSKSRRMPHLYSRDLEHCASNCRFWKSDFLAKFRLQTYDHSFLVGSPDQYFGGPRGVCTTEDECIWINLRVSWYSWKFWDEELRCGRCSLEMYNISLNANNRVTYNFSSVLQKI